MRRILRTVLSPLWSLFFLMMGGGFFTSFISVRMKNEGFSELAIGFVQASSYAGLLLGAYKVEKLLRRIGHIRAFAAFASVQTATILAQGIDGNPVVWSALRFVSGFCVAAMYVVIESWLLARSTTQTRGRILAIYMSSLYLSQSIGQFIFNILDVSTAAPFLITGFLSSLAIVPIAITHFSSPEVHDETPSNILSFFNVSPLGTLACIFSGVILSNIYSFTPNFAQDKGISVPLLMSSTIIGGALLQWPVGKLSDIFDRRHVLIAISLAIALPCLGLIFFWDYLPLAMISAFFLGGLCFTLYPLSITQVCDRVHPDDITTVTGALLLAYGAGAVLGPLVSPLFTGRFGLEALYWFIGSVGLLLGVFGIITTFVRKPIPRKDQGVYVPLPTGTPVAYDLDPRAPQEQDRKTH